jgi:hypothetical protein
MSKAFIIVPSGVELDPEIDPEIRAVAKGIVAHTVVVRTPECLGEAVIVAGKIITSLFLVRNYAEVGIVTPYGGEMQAIVAEKDERHQMAKLEPMVMGDEGRKAVSTSGYRLRGNFGPIGAVGDPLFVTDTKTETNPGIPVVVIAGMTYIINVCERKEDPSWKVDPKLPAGLIGGGIWNMSGEFVGLSLARKTPYKHLYYAPNYSPLGFDQDELAEGHESLTRLFAVHAETVMEFAETN